MKNSYRFSDIKSSRGAVSIYISFFAMLILAFLAFTFAYLVQKHALQVREAQFSMQAYYAAETGINDARRHLHEQILAIQQGGRGQIEVKDLGESSEGFSGDGLGKSVTSYGDRLVVGANDKVYIINKQSDKQTWALPQEQNKAVTISGNVGFGSSVSLDGDTLVIGSPQERKVYIYNLGVNSESPQQTIEKSGGSFGASVALWGSNLLVGDPTTGNGTVYHYVRSLNDTWVPASPPSLTETDGDNFGQSLSYDRGNLVVGSPGNSKVYVYIQGTSDWQPQAVIENKANGDPGVTPNHVNASNLGQSLALEEDVLIIGNGTKDVVVMQRRGQAWYWQRRQDIKHTVNIVSLSLDSGILVVGAPAAAGGNGHIHFFALENNVLQDTGHFADQRRCPTGSDIHPALRKGQLDPDGNIEYSCVIVDLTPDKLVYDALGTDRSLILQVIPVDADGESMVLDELTIEWDHSDPWKQTSQVWDKQTTSSTNKIEEHLTSEGNWSIDVPLLRMQITIVDLNQTITREKLNRNTEVFFLYPSLSGTKGKGGNHANYGGKAGSDIGRPGEEKQAAVLSNNCLTDPDTATPPDSGYSCKATISGIPKASEIYGDVGTGQLVYVVRLQAFYKSATLKITGSSESNQTAHFKNAQATITSTGRMANLFVRLQKSIPLRPVYDIAEYGIDSEEDICKLLVSTDIAGSHVYIRDIDDATVTTAVNLPKSCYLKNDTEPDWRH